MLRSDATSWLRNELPVPVVRQSQTAPLRHRRVNGRWIGENDRVGMKFRIENLVAEVPRINYRIFRIPVPPHSCTPYRENNNFSISRCAFCYGTFISKDASQ
jgi:hypothetical protein